MQNISKLLVNKIQLDIKGGNILIKWNRKLIHKMQHIPMSKENTIFDYLNGCSNANT